MNALYPFFISFIIIFLAELGDKTQLLVLSFAAKSKVHNILLGIAIGTFLSHGIAIIFGSHVGGLNNPLVLYILKIITYLTFLILGITGFIPSKEREANTKHGIISNITNTSLNYIFIVALSIIIGEIGDKTFIASLGLGFEYPNYKLSLITGAILGMILSNSVAIIFGKLIEKFIPDKYVQIISSIIFIIMGIIGLILIN